LPLPDTATGGIVRLSKTSSSVSLLSVIHRRIAGSHRIRNSASSRLCWSVQLSSCTHFIILYPHPILSTHYLLFLNYKPPLSPAKFSSDYDTGAGQLPALMFLMRTSIHSSTIIYSHHRNTYLSLYRLFIKSPPLSPSSRPSEPQ